MTQSRFTFCVPNLNKRSYLPECIESILAQDCPNWHCIFVDDFSTDDSWDYMQRFATDSRFQLLRGPNAGLYEGWNECLRHVCTEYFYILTSDDTCRPGLVSAVVRTLDQFPELDICHFQFELIDELGKTISSYDSIVNKYFPIYSSSIDFPHRRAGLTEFFLHVIFLSVYLSITSLAFRRSIIEKMGGFSSKYGILGDFEWTMRMGLYSDILYIPELLATWRVNAQQASKVHSYKDSQFCEQLRSACKDNFQTMSRVTRNSPPVSDYEMQQVVKLLSEHRASALYRDLVLELRRFRFVPNNIALLFSYVAEYPDHAWRNFARVFSLDLLDFTTRREFVLELLSRNHKLDWPPTPVILK